jgi:hypothetical protein
MMKVLVDDANSRREMLPTHIIILEFKMSILVTPGSIESSISDEEVAAAYFHIDYLENKIKNLEMTLSACNEVQNFMQLQIDHMTTDYEQIKSICADACPEVENFWPLVDLKRCEPSNVLTKITKQMMDSRIQRNCSPGKRGVGSPQSSIFGFIWPLEGRLSYSDRRPLGDEVNALRVEADRIEPGFQQLLKGVPKFVDKVGILRLALRRMRGNFVALQRGICRSQVLAEDGQADSKRLAEILQRL